MSNVVFENENFFVEVHESTIPWLKVFAKDTYKELSDMPKSLRDELYEITNSIENVMKRFYTPDKLNIAAFGNYMPQVHMHVMARFKEDAYFPEPMWGQRQREDKDFKGDFEKFLALVREDLEAGFAS